MGRYCIDYKFDNIFDCCKIKNMPKPISEVDKIYVRELLNRVLAKSKVSLTSKESYFKLQDIIHKHCDASISFSTLKRWFSEKDTTKPTKALLDIFCRYIGFDNWKAYLEDIRKYDRYMLQHEISLITIQKRIDTSRVKNLCERYGHIAEILPFVYTLIQLAKEYKDEYFFASVFSLPKVFEKVYHTEYDFYYLGQSVALCMRTNEKMAEKLANNYCKNSIATQYCIESFVDEDYLDGYYGKWLDEYHKHKTNDETKIFYYALKYKGALMNGDKKGRKFYYKKIASIDLKIKLPTIVEQRYLAIRLIEEEHVADPKKDILFNKIVRIAKKLNGKQNDYPLYILRYLHKAKKYKWMADITMLFDKYPAKADEHWLIKSNNAIQLYKSFAYHILFRKEEAIATFNSVDPKLFDPFMYECMMKDYFEIKEQIA